MPVDETSLDRIRNATFPVSRRGYDKQEVEKFLARLADWLETGGGDESRSDMVKRELERVGQRTGAILAQAEDSAQQIRAEAEEEARETLNAANAEAAKTRAEADSYSGEAHAKADEEARGLVADAEAQAGRIVAEGTRRREDIEAVITDLVRRRDEVLGDVEDLSRRLAAAVADRSPDGEDEFEKPEELDPLERGREEGEEATVESVDEEVTTRPGQVGA
jgi:DivIVA domain-containing protein